MPGQYIFNCRSVEKDWISVSFHGNNSVNLRISENEEATEVTLTMDDLREMVSKAEEILADNLLGIE